MRLGRGRDSIKMGGAKGWITTFFLYAFNKGKFVTVLYVDLI